MGNGLNAHAVENGVLYGRVSASCRYIDLHFRMQIVWEAAGAAGFRG